MTTTLLPEIFTPNGVLLQEDGFRLLQENGSALLLGATPAFYPATITGGSPVPIPYHPWCQRDIMTVSEATRGAMTVAEPERGAMTVTETARGNMRPGC